MSHDMHSVAGVLRRTFESKMGEMLTRLKATEWLFSQAHLLADFERYAPSHILLVTSLVCLVRDKDTDASTDRASLIWSSY